VYLRKVIKENKFKCCINSCEININMNIFARNVIFLRTVACRPALIRLPKNCDKLCQCNIVTSYSALSRSQALSTLANNCDKPREEQLIESPVLLRPDEFIEATDPQTFKDIAESFRVYKNFITEEEEKSLFDEVEPYLKRLKYETSHWDDVCIHWCFFI
jgi:hypothetical protein